MSLGEWLVRRGSYPLHEALRGRDTLRRARRLRALLAQDAPVVAATCADRLRDQLRYARAHLPFYSAWLACHGVDVEASDLSAELAKLPLLTKALVRANAAHMTNMDVPGGVHRGVTGGSTGDRLEFAIDRVQAAQTMAARLVMQGLFGARPGDRRAYLWGSPIELGGGRTRRWRDRLINEIMLNAFEMGPAALERHLARLRRFRPRVIYGYPSALALLARHAAERGGARLAGLRLVVATGETVTDDQRRQIRAAFGCSVAVEYGAREVGLIAHECPHGTLHVLAPHVHVELWSDDRPVGPGRVGEVVCTALNTRAQPLIHYRLGDLARWGDAACGCGLPLPGLRLDAGKTLGFIALAGGRLCNGAVTSHVLRDRPGIVSYRTHQRTLDEFDVLLVTDARYARDTDDEIRRRYRALFGARVQVRIQHVDHIPPLPSGKQRYVISDVASDFAAFDVIDEGAVLAGAAAR